MDGSEMIKLAKVVARRHYGVRGERDEDLISEGVLGIMRAEARYCDGSVARLTTYAYASARNAMRRYVAKETRWRNAVAMIGDNDYLPTAENDGGEAREVLDEIAERLGLKAGSLGREIMSGERQSDIARRRGISRQAVSKEFKKIQRRILDIYEYERGEISEK